MIPKTISHYQILSKLGEGGMGEVYLAEDTKLKRKVALKFLPANLTKDKDATERFKREAQAAAALNHPNIVTIHEIGEHEGQIYIAMEHVDGHSIREVIEKGSIEVEKVIDITKQICEGLDKAHEAEIVHRDIKPENILIDNDGRVRILDFGLARMKGVSKLTKESSTLGTVKYMSPEQLRGEEVDHRTDIWSLGVVMYEMLTGEVPFKGEYEQAVVYSILNEDISYPSSIPTKFEFLINKILQRELRNRSQTVQDIKNELLKVSTAKVLDDEHRKSIVVLPFENMSSDPEQVYFSDGLTEEIITDLSHIHDLLVISRSSAMTFKGTKKTIPEIAQAVNVRYVLEGSVRKAGNNLRITAQLIDAGNDAHLWAEKYNGTLDDVFDIQEKVSRSIVDALKIKLNEGEKQIIAERPFKDVRAYECYLKARHEIDSFTEDGVNRAIQYLESALSIVGESPVLYAGLGYAWWQYFNIGSKKEYLDNGLKWAGEALKIDPDSSEGHFISGNLYIFSVLGELKKGIYHLRRALEINPNNCEALFHLGASYLFLGRTAETLPFVARLLSIDPLNFYGYWLSSFFHLYEGRFKQALKQVRQSRELAPGVPAIEFFYALILIYNEQFEDVFNVIEQSEGKNPDNIFTHLGIFLKHAIKGEKNEALKSVTPEVLKWSSNDFTNPWYLVLGYSIIDEKEQALNWLEKWIDLGCINYPFLNKYDPFIENIRGEERFKKLMKRVKYEWENFGV
ncbi:hypothetical protein BVY00_01305 [bacterium G20]|nr:hypothetical protein BVY00_01305 [bacterium G20]